MGSEPFNVLNIAQNPSSTPDIFNSPTALALMRHFTQNNHQVQPQISSPVFNISSPSSSSTSTTPLSGQHSNMQLNGIDPNQSLCAICSDKATGRHYGCISSCDGCKGFFRRSIRKAHAYRCRFNNGCDVSKTHRNSCRACRLRRCLAAGMRVDAIQHERDAIGKRRKLDDDAEGNSFLRSLLNSEKLCAQLRGSVIKNTGQVVYDKGKIKFETNDKIATLNDVGSSIHQQLVLTVEWAKSLGEFRSLPLDDQAALLRLNATSLIVFAVALRSLNTENGICLANDKILLTEHASLVGDINAVVRRIVSELVRPIRELNMDSQEYVALKAIMFFNPYNNSEISDESTEKLKQIRMEALRALKTASLKRQQPPISGGFDDECRLGQLLLLLPSVQAVAQQLVEDVQLCRLFQLTNVDALMQALILHEKADQHIVEQLTGTSDASASIFTNEF